jgi:hypothetical protein
LIDFKNFITGGVSSDELDLAGGEFEMFRDEFDEGLVCRSIHRGSRDPGFIDLAILLKPILARFGLETD